ncbi:DUF192 domain-containing protein [Patescibacteria group bacterium]|nr:DUF192 domain-containing protein [Patescibacteria group bacterium]
MDNTLPKQAIQIQTSDSTYNLLVEVAEAKEDQERGLMGRENLMEDEGMLFVYESEVIPSYWMKNMEISLDILFIGADEKIKHIEKNVPPCEGSDDTCLHYSPLGPIKYVLELQSGFVEKYGVNLGDYIVLSS